MGTQIKDDFYTGTVTLYMFSENSNFALRFIDFILMVLKYLRGKSDDIVIKINDLCDKAEDWRSHIYEKDFPKGENKICV